jgi:hypothetical protein
MDEPEITVIRESESAHKIGPKSIRGPRVEVIAGNERRLVA